MLDTAQNVFIVIICLACALFFHGSHQLLLACGKEAGAQRSDWLATFRVWGQRMRSSSGSCSTRFGSVRALADLNADAEANSLVNVYRLRAAGLSPEERKPQRSWHGSMATRWSIKEWDEMANDIG